MWSATEEFFMNAADDPTTWRRFADMDMEAARLISTVESSEALASVICFHAQQAAEKYLKGLLVVHDEEPPRIHALPELLRRAILHVSDLDTINLEDAVNGLDQFYIPTRYPVEVSGSTGPITSEDAAEALAWAEEIAAVVRPRLES